MSSAPVALRPLHALLLAFVAFVWGSNFVVIRVGLDGFDPLLLAALRFALSSLPVLPFVKRPPVSWRWPAANGLLLGVGQFALLFIAMRGRVSPGLASLLMQTQVFFTIVMAAALFGDRIGARAVAGLVLGAAGLATVGAHLDASLTPAGLALTLAAAGGWAASNVVTQAMARRTKAKVEMFAYIAWSSLFAVPALVGLALLDAGPQRVAAQLAQAAWPHWAAALWQAVGNTLVGYVAWSAMLARYPATLVTPWALLVPVFGMSCSAWLTGEAMPAWKLVACALVLAGVAVANGAANVVVRRLMRA